VDSGEKNEEKDSAQKEREVVELYSSVCGSFPAIIRLTCNRKGKILQRLREMGGIKILEQVFRKMEASDFLKGNNRYGW
jgi:Cdc6-like AAA superfamily ATPase